MEQSFEKMLTGYQTFRKKYASGDDSIMQKLAYHGQKPEIMIVSCCDSRVDPGLILQTEPGELFIVRNVANIVPPFEDNESHHGTSAALEFAINHLNVKHLVIMGHSQCGGIKAVLDKTTSEQTHFIGNWISLIKDLPAANDDVDAYAKLALRQSYKNCLSFPWIKQRIDNHQLKIHLWFFDIKAGEIQAYLSEKEAFLPFDNIG